MGTQMRYFVEAVVLEDMETKKIDPRKGSQDYLTSRKCRIAEKAFMKFTWFHEAILPVGYYSNTAQVQILAQVADELLYYIDRAFYN
jgi:hypothetical protein